MSRQQYEFLAYAGDENGNVAVRPTVTVERLAGDGAARAKAGRLAKRINGPVDLAYAGAAEWSDRYITTASPSESHSSGFRFERLA